MHSKKLVLWSLWAGFIAYTLWRAPLDQPGNLNYIKKLVVLDWSDLNPVAIVLFSLMGVWPLVYACLMFIDARMQRISAWPSFLASNGSGVIGMMPYLLLRQPAPEFRGQKDWWLRIWDSRWTGVLLGLTTLGLLAYAALAGDWGDFWHQWRTNWFIHCMSWDFCCLYLVFPALLGDDMARRGLQAPRIFWTVALIPLLGPLAYLCLRPPLPEPSSNAALTESFS